MKTDGKISITHDTEADAFVFAAMAVRSERGAGVGAMGAFDRRQRW